jgi:Tfp pilus assembly protein PilX
MSSLIRRRLRQLRHEAGYTMIGVMILLLVGSLFSLAAWSAANNDIPQTKRDKDRKLAYAAAESGINYYLFRLNKDNAYWTNCDQVAPPNGTEQNPVNLSNATTLRWRKVQGGTADYAIELLPQNGATQCLTGASAASTMIDSSSGTMQIRATGRSGTVRRSVVATVRRSGFLDFLYFTDLETSDPIVYQVSDPTYAAWASTNCLIYRRAGRSSSCSGIVFADQDALNGPFHTNDDFLACGTPTFGRNSSDIVEVSSPPPGYFAGCGGSASPDFKGTWKTNASVLSLPASNTSIQSVAAPGYLFTGTTEITLNGGSMTVKNGGTTQTKALPSNGVIYVKNGTCGTTYNIQQSYNNPAGCADVYVKGSYSSSLTIASENDVIVNGSTTRSGNVVLGLIANNFVRVYHPVTRTSSSCTNAASGPFGNALGSVTIDAAILTLQHSFIVDNYNCGAALGTLTVNGAIAQKFRGPVGTGGSSISTGYIKDYNYDDRFRVVNPPYFLDPVQSSWRKIRYQEQVPARPGG